MLEQDDLNYLQEFIYNNKELEEIESIIDDFNIFTALKLQDSELKHSNFLAWLLDPSENHGLGDYFLRLFLKYVTRANSNQFMPSIFEIDSWDFDNSEIRREWEKIDILIKNDALKFVCLIENKINSSEHSNQLDKYKKIINTTHSSYKKILIYLTVEKENPSDEDYIPIGYDDILILLEQLEKNKHSQLNSEVLIFIRHYIEMLRRYIMENSRIQEICEQIYTKHKRALDLIFEFKPDEYRIISDIFQKIIAENPELILDYSGKTLIRFIPKDFDFIPHKGEGWYTEVKRILLFEIKNNENNNGLINLTLIIGPGDPEIRKKLMDIARGNPKLFNKAGNKAHTEKFFTCYKKTLFKHEELKDIDTDEIRIKLQNKLNEIKNEDFGNILQELKKLQDFKN